MELAQPKPRVIKDLAAEAHVAMKRYDTANLSKQDKEELLRYKQRNVRAAIIPIRAGFNFAT